MLENGFEKCMLYMFLLRKTFFNVGFLIEKIQHFFDLIFHFSHKFQLTLIGVRGNAKNVFFTLLKNLFDFVCKKQSRMLAKISVFLNIKFTFLSHFLLRKTQKNIGFLIEKIQHFLYKMYCFYDAFLGTLLNEKCAFS